MSELGGTNDPKALVPGEPREIRASLNNLVRYGDRMIAIGDGLRKIDTGSWSGTAADRFRARFDYEPARWTKAGDAFHSTATTIDSYTSTLEWAQGEARRAIEMWQQAERASQQAQADHDRAGAEAERRAAEAGAPPPTAAPFVDPGDAMRREAEEILQRARAGVASAGHEAVGIVERNQREAPEAPTLLDDIASGLGDAAETIAEVPGNLAHYAMDGFGNAVDAVGSGAGYLVQGLGKGMDALGMDGAGQSVQAAGADVVDWSDDRANDIRTAADDVATTLGVEDPAAYGFGQDEPRTVFVDQGDYPEAADHVREAQMGTSWRGDESFARTQPGEVTIDRDGAEERRDESMKQVPQTKPGADRDEYPPAMFAEGGEGSSVKYIDPHDNRGAGRSLSYQTSDLDDGERVIIKAD